MIINCKVYINKSINVLTSLINPFYFCQVMLCKSFIFDMLVLVYMLLVGNTAQLKKTSLTLIL